jgi:hypothetical protein
MRMMQNLGAPIPEHRVTTMTDDLIKSLPEGPGGCTD